MTQISWGLNISYFGVVDMIGRSYFGWVVEMETSLEWKQFRMKGEELKDSKYNQLKEFWKKKERETRNEWWLDGYVGPSNCFFFFFFWRNRIMLLCGRTYLVERKNLMMEEQEGTIARASSLSRWEGMRSRAQEWEGGLWIKAQIVHLH